MNNAKKKYQDSAKNFLFTADRDIVKLHINPKKENNVEILCIGSELLLGNILNTNAKFLSEQLALSGLNHYQQTVVGDNHIRLGKAIIDASKRSNILITTGGLGPTIDDITHETIAKTFNYKLEERADVTEKIIEKLGVINDGSKLSARKQAMLPLEAEIIPNKSGTAPGIIFSPTENFIILTFPGVPSELKEMWFTEAFPWLKSNIKQDKIFISKILKFTGIGESSLERKISDLMTSENPTIAPYAGEGEVKLRITANATEVAKAEELIDPFEKEIKTRLGFNFFGSNDETLASIIINLLKSRKETLAVAESCTGGRLGSTITSVPGSSEVFIGGIIAYQNIIKENLLGVSKKTLQEYGAVSEEVAKEMAEGALNRFGTDWAIAISGLAGPGGATETKSVGLIYIAIAERNSCESICKKFDPRKGRTGIQNLSVVFALDKLRLILSCRS